jgi:hypothetical protein
MIQSQEIALRCAAACYVELRGRIGSPLPWYMHETNRKSLHTLPSKLHRQIEACADPAARRLILGTSK